MAKIHKYNDKTKPLSINLKEIFAGLSQSPLPLLALSSKYYGLEFIQKGKRYICTKHSGIKIEPYQGFYTLNNFSNALGIKGGRIKQQLFNLTTGLTGIDRVNKQIAILDDCGLVDGRNAIDIQTASKNARFSHLLPNTKQIDVSEPKQIKKPVFVEFSTLYGQKVFEWLNTKTGATIDTLKKYNVHPTTSNNEVRYSYQVGDTIKAKTPTRDRISGKYYTYKHSKNYLFGFEQLPQLGNVLIFASGEDDTICINQNLNSLGIFAVCGWNETNPPPDNLLQKLKKRFKSCYLLGDNDNIQTTASSREIALKTGLNWIDTDNARAFFDFIPSWDICDIYQNTKKLKDFILFCIGSNSQIKAYSDDPDTISVPHCYNLNFSQYIGEKTPNKYGIIPTEFILHQIRHNDRLIIQSLAGTGKSTLMTLLVHQADKSPKTSELQPPNMHFLDALGIERVIILEPTTAINAQLPEAFKERGLAVAALDNLSDSADMESALSSRVIMVCYDSLKRVAHLLENSLVIVDEYHQLPIDINFRNNEAFRLVINGLEKAKKVLLLSATPNYLFTLPKSVHKSLGYKLIRGVPSIQNTIPITPLIYEGNRRDIPTFIAENSPIDKGLITIKLDVKADLKNFIDGNNNRGIPSDLFHSGDAKRKEGNANYNSIMKTGYLDSPLRYLCYTTLMEAGVSIKEQVALNCLLDVESWQKTIQLISRARYNHKTEVNKISPVWIFRSKQSISKEQPYNKPPILSRFNALLKMAQNLSDVKNDKGVIDGNEAYSTLSDDKKTKDITFKNEETGLYEPCILWILRLLYEQEKSAPFEFLLKRCARYDSRIKILPSESIHTSQNPELEALRAAQKVAKEDANFRLLSLLKDSFNNVAQTVCYLSKSPDFKQEIRDGLKLPQVSKSSIIDFLDTANGAFTGNEPKRMINDACFLSNHANMSKPEIIDLLTKLDKNAIKELKSQTARKHRHRSMIRGGNAITNHDKLMYHRERAITKKLDQLKKDATRNKRSEWLKSTEITAIINKAIRSIKNENSSIFFNINDRKAMIILSDLYEVEKRKMPNGKKRVLKYKIGVKK